MRVDDVAGNIWQALPGSASKMVAGSERLSQHAATQGRAANVSPALTLTVCSQCTECTVPCTHPYTLAASVQRLTSSVVCSWHFQPFVPETS